MVRSSCLDCTSIGRDASLDARGEETTREFFIFTLDSLNHRDCEQFFINSAVQILNEEGEGVSFFESCMCSVSFLPEELTSTDERSRILELPSNDVSPLIKLQR